MFELVVRQKFEAAHVVHGHTGKCGRLHGHNFVIDAFFLAEKTDHIGIAVEFADLKGALKEIIAPLDHVYLNELPAFSGDNSRNPTAENIAKYIYAKLHVLLKNSNARLSKVTVWETDGCAATYFLAPGEILPQDILG